jgi:ubiquinone/menaquinone biosynthesis C-methylase UbiE
LGDAADDIKLVTAEPIASPKTDNAGHFDPSHSASPNRLDSEKHHDYFNSFLDKAPLALAIWRASEAKALERVQVVPPVLDLGCGFGEFAGVFFDATVDIGVDPSQVDLSRAEAAGKHALLIRGDARALPLPDASVSTVLSNSVLEHISGPERVLAEAFRVLRPHGVFAFTVVTSHMSDEMLLPRAFNRIHVKRLAHLYATTYHRLFSHVSLHSKDAWVQMTHDAGFELVAVDNILTRKALLAFELLLVTAVPSQVARTLAGRRLNLVPRPVRQAALRPFRRLLEGNRDRLTNVLVVARKP